MSGIVGVSPIRAIGMAGALRAVWRRSQNRLRSGIERIRAEGGLPLGLALPVAITMTSVISCVVVVVASSARPV